MNRFVTLGVLIKRSLHQRGEEVRLHRFGNKAIKAMLKAGVSRFLERIGGEGKLGHPAVRRLVSRGHGVIKRKAVHIRHMQIDEHQIKCSSLGLGVTIPCGPSISTGRVEHHRLCAGRGHHNAPSRLGQHGAGEKGVDLVVLDNEDACIAGFWRSLLIRGGDWARRCLWHVRGVVRMTKQRELERGLTHRLDQIGADPAIAHLRNHPPFARLQQDDTVMRQGPGEAGSLEGIEPGNDVRRLVRIRPVDQQVVGRMGSALWRSIRQG